MQIKPFAFFISLWLISLGISAQTLDLASNFSTSNAPFYKDVPGMQIGFSYPIKNKFLFAEIKTSRKNNSYTQSQSEGYPGFESYYTQRVNGKLYVNTIKLGLAQKLINSDAVCISLGAFASLNYLKFNDQAVTFDYVENRTGGIWHDTRNEGLKNKWGLGGFIDMEIKQVILKKVSLFSRLGLDYVELIAQKNRSRGYTFQNNDYSSLEFALGLRYDLKRGTAAPK